MNFSQVHDPSLLSDGWHRFESTNMSLGYLYLKKRKDGCEPVRTYHYHVGLLYDNYVNRHVQTSNTSILRYHCFGEVAFLKILNQLITVRYLTLITVFFTHLPCPSSYCVFLLVISQNRGVGTIF